MRQLTKHGFRVPFAEVRRRGGMVRWQGSMLHDLEGNPSSLARCAYGVHYTVRYNKICMAMI